MKKGNEGIKLSLIKGKTVQKMIENGDQVLYEHLCSIKMKVQDYEMPEEVEKFLGKFADVFEKPFPLEETMSTTYTWWMVHNLSNLGPTGVLTAIKQKLKTLSKKY